MAKRKMHIQLLNSCNLLIYVSLALKLFTQREQDFTSHKILRKNAEIWKQGYSKRCLVAVKIMQFFTFIDKFQLVKFSMIQAE